MLRRGVALVLGTAVLLILVPAANAQLQKLRGTTPEFRAGMWTDMMKRTLDLSPAQLEQVQRINLDTAQKMQPIIEGKENPLRALREAAVIDRKKNEALAKVLTPAQMEKLKAQRAQGRQRHGPLTSGERQPGLPGPAGSTAATR
jgi:Spy/CpxP family protein refolding chaperone